MLCSIDDSDDDSDYFSDDDDDDDDDHINTITIITSTIIIPLVRKELRVLSRLDNMPISRATKRQVAQLLAASSLDSSSSSSSSASSSSPSQIRIDMSKGGKHVVSFLNNLEKDPMYRGMPRSLKVMWWRYSLTIDVIHATSYMIQRYESLSLKATALPLLVHRRCGSQSIHPHRR